ncbi:MAG: hypothetical protein ACFFD7_14560, partial [Candidatus Thorarchaeota archaeon]
MIYEYNPNYGFSLIEAALATLGLLIVISFTVNIIFGDEKIAKKKFRRGSVVTCLIIFGIIFGIRILMEILRVIVGPFMRIFMEDMLFFAIMVTIFYPLHRPFVKKFGFLGDESEDISSIYSNYRFFFKVFFILTWIATAFFISIPILSIPMENPDIFNLSIIWSFAVVAIDMLITIAINRTMPNEKRIARKVLRKSMYMGALIAFGMWILQLLIFELYLNRWLGIQFIKQDIRVLIIVISGLYSTFFYYSLRTKFSPESSDTSLERLQWLMKNELDHQVRIENMDDDQIILEDQAEYSRPPEGISFKVYVYFLRKFDKANLSDEEIAIKGGAKKFHIPLGGVLWAMMITILVISIFLSQNLIGE